MSNYSDSSSFSSPLPSSLLSSLSDEEDSFLNPLPKVIEISSSSESQFQTLSSNPGDDELSPMELAQNTLHDPERSFIITMKKNFMEGRLSSGNNFTCSYKYIHFYIEKSSQFSLIISTFTLKHLHNFH